MYMRTCGVVSSQKSLGPQIAKSQSTNLQITKNLAGKVPHFAEGAQNITNYKSSQVFVFAI
jgi:hypothetical protein